MSERNIFEGIEETVEFEIENTDALKELFNKTKEENLKIQKRFADGTYTEDDLLNHLPRFGLGTKDKIEMYVVESKYFEDLANRYTNLKEIEKSHQEENGKLRVKLTKQEKMIEYMVNWINDHEDPFEGCHENEKCGDDYISCEQCIKQYFEKKAEESE